MLIDGKWQDNWTPFQGESDKGEFVRQRSSFRNWITPDGSAGRTGNPGFKAELGRYHLYVAYICPWACRTLATIALKGLEDVFTISVVDPQLGDQGWEFTDFPESTHDHLYGYDALHQLYSKADANYTGKATVPLLWDKKTNTAVNNESADIIEMLNNAFEPWAKYTLDLRPNHLLPEILELNESIYEHVNNGVYRCGFARSQEAYDEAFNKLFEGLEALEQRLEGQQYLLGDQITETDVRLFVTLVRFDVAYYGLFKTNKKRIAEFSNLNRFMNDVYRLPGVAKTVNIDHIKAGYYSIRAINPFGIVPQGPHQPFDNMAA